MKRWMAAWLAAWMLLCIAPLMASASSANTPTDLHAAGSSVLVEDGCTITVQADRSAARPGDMVLLTVTVGNKGDRPMKDVTLTTRGWQTGAALRQGLWNAPGWRQQGQDAVTLPSLVSLGAAEAVYAGKTSAEEGNASCAVGISWLEGGDRHTASAVVTLDVQPASGLSLSVTEGAWPWKAGAAHTFTLALTNIGEDELTAVSLHLADVLSGTRSVGAPIVTAVDGKALKKKQQLPTWTAEAISAGQTMTLDCEWTAPDSLAGITGTALLAEALATDSGGTTVTAADELELVRPAWRRTASELPIGSATVQSVLWLLGGAAGCLLVAAGVRWMLCRRKDKWKE